MGAAAPVHPTDATLRSYALGKLDDASAGSVSKHLDSCPDCRNRVAEMSSDSFLGRLRDAGIKPGSPVSAPVVSSFAGLSMLDAGVSPGSPPPAGTLPPGLADHPDYDVIRELGQGGMGTVYLAMNRLMGRHEVLKVVSSHLTNRHGVLDRFLVEIRNAARLHHTNIVTAYSASRAGESIIFAMEFVDGLDLAKLVKAKGGLPVANSCNYVHQAALGLQHADDLSMVHRDIKPSNLMLAKQGNRAVIKVLDFGLAKVRSERAVDRGLTHEGQMLGTPDFIAPEQIGDARRADIRADIYSLGCTLYYLLTGGPPFQATSLYEILQAHHSMDALPLNLARPEVPVELAALAARMMAKEPARRFQRPKDVAQAILPFFKNANAGANGSTGKTSPVGVAAEGRMSLRMVTATTDSATNPALPPPPSPQKTAPTAGALPLWESLIELKENDSSGMSAPAEVKARTQRPRPLRLWSAVASVVFLLGFVAVLGMTLRVKTPKGDDADKGASRADVAKPRVASGSLTQKAQAQTTSDPGATVRAAPTKSPAVVPPVKELFDPDKTYRLVTRFQPTKSLDVRKEGENEDQAILAETSDFPGQQWRIIPLGDGWSRITNKGNPAKSLGIRNDGNDNDQPIMADTGNFVSQHWRIIPLGDGWYRITSRQRSTKSLDIINDGKDNNRLKVANSGHFSGQVWKITAHQ